MATHAKRVEISSVDRQELERLARSRAGERRWSSGARIVLLAGEGRPAAEIAETTKRLKNWLRLTRDLGANLPLHVIKPDPEHAEDARWVFRVPDVLLSTLRSGTAIADVPQESARGVRRET